MRKSILSTVVMLGAAGSLTACDFEQPNPGCIVQDASFANWYAKYDAVGVPTGADCSRFEPLTGEQLGVWKFADPKLNTAKLVIRPLTLAGLGQFDATNTFDGLQATGNLSTTTDAEDFCSATDFNSAGVNATTGKANEGEEDEIDYSVNPTQKTYQFANVRVYSSPGAPGTQMTGELTYTSNGCTAQYVMRAVWPVTGCDPDADPTLEENFVDTCGLGSGINPDFAVTCDPELGFCVPTNPIPSFK
ncbi:hypothetical protein [Corallococcus exercitus]|uniref:hypothetical protein n=1 Tax=Corallococcus exercitus TaxID=2316736 RepID=UPI0035D4B051